MGRAKTLPLLLSASLLLLTPPVLEAGPDAAFRADAARRIAALPKGDATAAYRLALDLEAQGCADLAKDAHWRAVAADPDHAAARRALGFERVGGRWLVGDDLLRAKGFVKAGGRWVLAEEVRPAVDPVLARLRKAAAGLQSARTADRAHAAQEIARVGDPRGIAILAHAWARAASEAGGPRGFFAQSRQMSYVQDFDVEVA
jgi:hypothetical protein